MEAEWEVTKQVNDSLWSSIQYTYYLLLDEP